MRSFPTRMTEVTARKGPSADGLFTFSAITWVLGAGMVVVAFFLFLASNDLVGDDDQTPPAERDEMSGMIKATHRASIGEALGDIGIWFVGIGTAGLALSVALAGWARIYDTEA